MRLCVAALAAALCFTSIAHAQAKPAVTPADDVEAAKAHFAAGSAYYDQANYADAVKEFNEAYRLSHRSDLLYNIAVCYERLMQYDNAIKALQQYLNDRPDAKDKVSIQTRIANLEKQRDTMPPRPVEPPPAQPNVQPQPSQPAWQPPPPEYGPRTPGWWVPGTALGAAGLAVLAGSLGTGLAADADFKDLKNKCGGISCPSDPALVSQRDRGQALAIASDVLLGVGAAATAAGVILLGVQSRRPHVAKRASILPTPFGVAGTF